MSCELDFEFTPLQVEEWTGRYSRIPGDASVFRVVHGRYGRYVIQAYIETPDGRQICQAVECRDVDEMVDAINEVKLHYSGRPGGSFLLNEYGQVLVPTMRHGRFLVGQTTGVLPLRNLDTGEILDLSDDYFLEPGDPWELPYVGMIYHLSTFHRLYYCDNDSDHPIYPPFQDQELIRKIRSIRPYGPVRLLVNPYGIVLTKLPGEFDFDETQWDPVYMGCIDYDLWFEKEGVS